ncbi:RagB/SusD family nutrient uptake outer membrane protein [Aquimarina sediminis]|uniref:RagB/SusD family nutrient uptake outer membrane protein n=1 Tax=Aquimarina sediminis TaxID=2070536 RepID=UPI000CA03D7F|nr:RagB/SusD family nutrient uptake outer membrane protein [Aquimarina sediminis]
MKKSKINNIKVKLTFVFLISLCTISCSEDFLEEPTNTRGLSSDVVFSNRTIAESYVSGILRNFRAIYENLDTAGLHSIYFARTIKGNDLIQSPSWYMFDYTHENRDPNFRRTIFTWDYLYENINYANVLIFEITHSDLDENTKKEFIAVGKTLRAFHYFQLALEFAPNYKNNVNVAKLPIYTTPATGKTEGNPPSTLKEVYDLILSDLKEAIVDLPESRLGKSYINNAVANGILARVLLVTMDDWTLASSSARAAYGGDAASAVPSSNYGIGFLDMTDPEWIWGMYQDEVETNGYYSAPHGMTDHTLGFYKATYVNANFVNQFSDTDSRKLFANIYGSTTPYREYVTSKFSFVFEADVSLMRKSEMVLIDAEAQYHLGNESAAHTLLFALQSDRDPNAIMSTNTGQALLDEILLERRKELYGELGVEWFDAKRYRLPIDRDPNHRVEVDVPVDSELFYLNIPQKEIDANPNINNNINN